MVRNPSRGLSVFALALTVPLWAQQSPLVKEHALLSEMAGDWKVTSTGAATTAGKRLVTEQRESGALVCGGLWLETVARDGDRVEHGLVGFDTVNRRFVRLRIAGADAAVIEDGEFDAQHRTITWRIRGTDEVDAARRVLELPIEGPRLERVNGVERVFARVESQKVVAPAAAVAQAKPEYALLARLAGDWDCVLDATIPGLDEPMRSVGHMRDEVVAGGCWLRSSYESEFGGIKIEGRGVMGYDPKQKRCVRYWADSGSAMLSISSSALDAAGRKMVGTGTTQMPGGDVTFDEEIELGADGRKVTQKLRTSYGTDAGTFVMVMTRRPAPKAK